MKKLPLLVLLAMSMLFLTGCWDRIELNDLSIVMGTAIDKKGNNIELTVQIFTPKSLSGGSGVGGGGVAGGGGGSLTLVRSETGVDVAEAISKLQKKLPRKIFWGHCKVYIFGEQLAKTGIHQSLDFLIRHPQPRINSNVYISKGAAKEALNLLPPLERFSTEVLRELSGLHIEMNVTLTDLLKTIKGDSKATVVPYIKVLPPSKGMKKNQTIAYIHGAAVFNKDKMIGYISENETKDLRWLRNEVNITTVTIQLDQKNGHVSLYPVRGTTELVPMINDGKWKMLVKIKIEGRIVQNGTKLDLSSPLLQAEVKKELEQDVRKRLESFLGKLQHNLKADIVGFAEEFHRKYPNQWEEAKSHWDEVFPTIDVEFQIQPYIRKPGAANQPVGIPADEVRKQ